MHFSFFFYFCTFVFILYSDINNSQGWKKHYIYLLLKLQLVGFVNIEKLHSMVSVSNALQMSTSRVSVDCKAFITFSPINLTDVWVQTLKYLRYTLSLVTVFTYALVHWRVWVQNWENTTPRFGVSDILVKEYTFYTIGMIFYFHSEFYKRLFLYRFQILFGYHWQIGQK